MGQLPKYMVLVNWIKEQLSRGEIRQGERFYSENELAKMFTLSRQTVRQAVGILEQEGFVERRRGSGTFVCGRGIGGKSRSYSIGVISTYLDDYIFPSIIRGIETVLTQGGYTMQLSFTHNLVENETRSLGMLLEKQVDGLIVEPTKSALPSPNGAIYRQLWAKGIPVLFFNAYYPNLPFPHVALDDRKAGRIATECLLERGHRQIAGMFQADDLQGHLRYAGYVDAMQKAGMEVCSKNVLWFTTEDIGFLSEDFKRVRRVVSDCTGLVAYNDQIALQVCRELQGIGLRVPDDLSVVGIDNAEISLHCDPALCSVAHPGSELGESAAKNLLHLLDDPSFDATVDFPPRLIVRDSVRRL